MKAIIIGAGIGGLAAGIAMQRAGIEVEIYERAEAMEDVGAGLSLWANAIHALDRLGLTGAIRPLSAPSAVAGLRTWDGHTLSTSPSDLEQRVGPLVIVVHRAELLDALMQACGPARVRLGARCERFEQNGNRVSAVFASGERAHGDILVGADGLHSVVRAQLHGRRPPVYAGYTAWRGVVRFDTDRVPAGESWGYGSRFGHVPMTNSRVYWFATENTPADGRHPDEKAHLLQLFRGWHQPIEALVTATPADVILRNDIYDRPVLSRWGEGRVTLLGDAAHPMTPNLGQGACQALEDAVVLARCLRERGDPVEALRAYEAERIPRANMIVNASRRFGWMAQFQHPLAVRLRNAITRNIGPRVQARELERVIGFRV